MERNWFVKNIPNMLSLSRIALSVAAIVLGFWVRPENSEYYKTIHWIVLGFFIWCAVSDTLDGKLARGLKVESSVGQFLDGIADTLCFVTMFVYFFLQTSFMRDIMTLSESVAIWISFIVTVALNLVAILTIKKKHGVSDTMHPILQKTSSPLMFVVLFIQMIMWGARVDRAWQRGLGLSILWFSVAWMIIALIESFAMVLYYPTHDPKRKGFLWDKPWDKSSPHNLENIKKELEAKAELEAQAELKAKAELEAQTELEAKADIDGQNSSNKECKIEKESEEQAE